MIDLNTQSSNAVRFSILSERAASASIIAPLTGIRLDAGQSLKMSGITDATGGNPRVHGSFDLELIKL